MSQGIIMRVLTVLMGLVVCVAPAMAAEKFKVEGDRLIYDTFAPEDETHREIERGDIDAIKKHLRDNPDIRALQLNSDGGLIYAAAEISDVVIDYNLDTIVSGICSSACTTIFLAGNARSVTRGSKIGFHRSFWSASSMRTYYDSYKEDEDWDTPFEFAEWVQSDAQDQVFHDLEYLIERGVNARFAIKTLKAESDDMWYPRRRELEDAG
jgi:hypothetical protein